MKRLEDIFKKYEAQRADMIYSECVELLSLVTDEELAELCDRYPSVFTPVINKTAEEIKQNIPGMLTVRNALRDFLLTRNLSEDEFEAMTLDDVKDYLCKLITKKSDILLAFINKLEDDSRDSSNKSSVK